MRFSVWILYLVSATAAAREIWYPAQGSVNSENPNLKGQVSVGTFNSFLYRGTLGFEERKDLLIKTLQSNEVPDILCLQEVFRRSDAKDVVDAVKEDYPYYASFQDLEEGASLQRACTLQELQSFTDCMTLCTQEGGCGLRTCEAVVSFPCLNCIGMELYPAELGTLMNCFTVPLNEYKAPYGLLLLSRFPLSGIVTKDYLDGDDYSPTLLPRKGYISAKVDSYTFICTHLTTVLDPVLYDGPPFFSSYEEQQTNQTRVIHQVVEGMNNVILLGDFNHGPASPGLEWQVPLSYGLMTARGFFSANVLWCGQCTICSDNELTQFYSPLGMASTIIDHIYLPTSKASAVVRVDRMFDSIYTSGPSVLHLSDHYGVRAVLDFTEMNQGYCPGSDILEKDPNLLELGCLPSSFLPPCDL